MPIYYPDRSPEEPTVNEIDVRTDLETTDSPSAEDEHRRRAEEAERRRLAEEERRRIDEEQQRKDQENHLGPLAPEYLTTTTTTRPTRRRPSKQDPICKLPVEPELDVDFDAGYRFGTTGDSRIEFTQIPGKVKKAYEFSLQFNTAESNGVLFYAGNDNDKDFIGLYLKNGYVS